MREESVGIIGVGRLGSDVAFTLAERDLCDIVLYDKEPDRAEYLASDLSDTSFGHVYNRRVIWTDTLRELSRCSVILVAAGARAEEHSSPEALFRENRGIAEEIATTFVGSSNLFVVASEPVDLMTAELTRLLRVPPSRVMGIGGVVDSYRVRSVFAEALSLNPDFVVSQVIGPHGGDATVLWEFSSVNGVSLRQLAEEELLDRALSELKSDTDAHLRQMSKTTSRYTPAMACLELLRSLVLDDRRVLSVTMQWPGILGISGIAMSVPCVVGRFGAERPILPSLDATTHGKLKESAETLAAVLRGVAS
ncbi:MAG: lactate/malate family dehydrogenase [Spirochaetaceae bacterium]